MSNKILLVSELKKTIENIRTRLAGHFPDSGLYKTSGSLYEISQGIEEKLIFIHSPDYTSKVLSFLFILCVASIVYFLSAPNFKGLFKDMGTLNVSDLAQMFDAVFNLIVLLGAGVIFLFSWEHRTKTDKIIKEINQLKCIAHLIDAHQLLKDPLVYTYKESKHALPEYELGLYLDYCMDLLSMVNKLAFLYVQSYSDSKANEMVNGLEAFTNGLCQKLNQKIALLQHERIKNG